MNGKFPYVYGNYKIVIRELENKKTKSQCFENDKLPDKEKVKVG